MPSLGLLLPPLCRRQQIENGSTTESRERGCSAIECLTMSRSGNLRPLLTHAVVPVSGGGRLALLSQHSFLGAGKRDYRGKARCLLSARGATQMGARLILRSARCLGAVTSFAPNIHRSRTRSNVKSQSFFPLHPAFVTHMRVGLKRQPFVRRLQNQTFV